MSTNYVELILEGIRRAGGEPSDLECVQEEGLIELGRTAGAAGRSKRRIRNPSVYGTSALIMPESLPLPVPQDGAIFELTFDSADADPIQMVKGDGYQTPEKWQFKGPAVDAGVKTKKFKLVSLKRHMQNAYGVNAWLLSEHGIPAMGQWRAAFARGFASPNRNILPICFTGSEWMRPGGGNDFTYLCSYNSPWVGKFQWFGYELYPKWRFLVEVE